MIKARGSWIRVKLYPATGEHANKLGLILVDQKKHHQHQTRCGVIESVGDGVVHVKVGDKVFFQGSAGFSTDYEYNDEYQIGNEQTHRWIREDEILLVEEPEKVKEAIASKELQEVV